MGKACTAALGALLVAAGAAAQGGLAIGGAHAASGIHALGPDFSPDPFRVESHPHGTMSAIDLRLGPGCRGFLSREPDVIVRLSGAPAFVRFFARAPSDVTLVIVDPAGRTRCNDDVVPGRDTNPMIDLHAPRAGQYDVWIGVPAAGARVDAAFFVTADRELRP